MSYRHTIYGIRNHDAEGRVSRPTYFGHTNPDTLSHDELLQAWSLAAGGRGSVLVDWREDDGAAGVDWWPAFAA